MTDIALRRLQARNLIVAIALLLGADAVVLAARTAGPVDAAVVALAPPVPVAGRAAAPRPWSGPLPAPAAAEEQPAPARAAALPPAPERSAAPPSPAAPAPAAPAPPAPAEPAPVPLVPVAPNLRVFAGLSTWIDLHDTQLTPEQQVAAAAAGGVDALFVQTARFNSPTDVHDAERLAAVIEGAHDAGIKVMTWYIPDFLDEARDLRRAQWAMAFVTPRGDRPDGFGLDIETEHQVDVAERTRRLLALSAALRTWAGPDYPMAAIVLPPLQLDLRPSWWPDFPYAALRPFYDVYIPMSYSSFRGRDAATTHRWNLDNVVELRRRTGDPNLPVHLAGGIADALPELGAWLDAARDGKVVGGGLYDLHTTRPHAWAALRALRLP